MLESSNDEVRDVESNRQRLACGVLLSGVAFAQVSTPNPTQGATAGAGEQVPLFRVTVVGRTTSAINYRPRRGDTKVDFAGTSLMPAANGYATVSGEKGYIKVDARFDKLAPPTQFGPEYLTYVLWAITPEGRATNLGEVQRDDEDARVQVTTELQAFGLVLTAEPYFAVTQPSDVVVMENVVRDNTKGNVETIQAKYELLKRGSYLMNQDAARLKIKPLEPGAPLDLAQARNAVELARLAGADRYAAETFGKAVTLLATAEQAREKRRGSNEIMMPARQAAQTAEDARLVGLQRQEEASPPSSGASRRLGSRRPSAGRRPKRRAGARRSWTRRTRRRRARPPSGSRRRQRRERSRPWPSRTRQAREGRGRRGANRGGERPRAGRCGATRRRGAGRAGAAARRPVRAGEGAAARSAAAAAQRDPGDARDGARADRQSVRRAVRHRPARPEAGCAREAGASVGHPVGASGPEDGNRGPHRQRRHRRIQPAAVRTACRVGAELSGQPEHRAGHGDVDRLWRVETGRDQRHRGRTAAEPPRRADRVGRGHRHRHRHALITGIRRSS